MMSLEAIKDESRRQARRAARLHKRPYIYEEDDKGKFPPFPFPNIGDYRPKGYRLVNQYFVDKTGWGTSSEPALTLDQLLEVLRPGMGYAIIEEGEFQLYIGEFEVK
jgi:hypothetical protein